MAQRVLLLGTSFSAAPLAHFLRSAGYHVAVCGKYPHDPCVTWADSHHSLDYSSSSELKEFLKGQEFTAICPSCNDYAYLSAAQVASEIGYPGFDNPDATAIIADKARFRAFAQNNGIPVPKTWDTDTNRFCPSGNDFPMLAKPVDSFSGRGVNKINNAEELGPAIAEARAASRVDQIIVEQFVEGTLHSHSAFLQNRDIVQDVFVDEFCTVYPYQVNCSNCPSRLSDAIRRHVRDCIHELASLLHLCDGLLHTQFMVDGQDIYLIECMRRCPGDLFFNLVSFSTGMPYIANYLWPFLGENPTFSNHDTINSLWARHTISLPRDIVFQSFAHTIPSREMQYFPLRESGSLVHQAPFDKIAILFARFEKPSELFSLTPRLHEMITVNSMGLDERNEH